MLPFKIPMHTHFGNYLLKDFNDIVLPKSIPFTPQTTGAWLLLSLALISLLFVLWWQLRKWQANAYRREAIMVLGGGPLSETIALVPSSLRRVAAMAYPNLPIGALTGAEWFNFLNHSAKVALFPLDIQKHLEAVSYQPPSVWMEQNELNTLSVKAALQWIELHDPEKLVSL